MTRTSILIPFLIESLPNTGAAFIFSFDGSLWNFVKAIFSQNPQANGRFGSSVSVGGGHIIVGARGENSIKGSVHFFTTDGDFVDQFEGTAVENISLLS